MSRKSNRLRALFNEKLEKLAKEDKEEQWQLVMRLVNWGNQPVLLKDKKFWDMLEGQIRLKAEKLGISPKKVIKYLFSQKTAKEWMSEFE